MKKFMIILFGALMMLSFCPLSAEEDQSAPVVNPFTDVSRDLGNTTFKSILWAYDKGIVKGTSDTTYSPSAYCTRAQLCVMLWRLKGKPAINATDNPFPDVDTSLGNTTYKAILWAYQEGIVKGNADGRFDPNGNTTRANMAVMLWRTAGKPTVTASSSPFVDVSSSLGNTTYKSILWAYDVKLTKGTDDTHFSPFDPCTRAQLAVFLYRLNLLYGYVEKEVEIAEDEPEVMRTYAVLTDSGDLIFFNSKDNYTSYEVRDVKDVLGNIYHGMVFTDVETSYYYPWFYEAADDAAEKIRRVYVAEGSTYQPLYMDYMFEGCTNLTDFDSKGFDTSKVTDLTKLFMNCSSLKRADVSYFDTKSVTSLWAAFLNCSSLKEIDLSNWDTSETDYIGDLFEDCTSLEKVNLTGWNTSKVTNMRSLFEGCESLKEVDVTGFDTSNVTVMSDMFGNCKSLIRIDLSSFDTSNVEVMRYMFDGAESLEEVVLGEKFTVWDEYAPLPEGFWSNGELTLNESDLRSRFVEDPAALCGTWSKQERDCAVLTSDGELVFMKTKKGYEHQQEGEFVDRKGNTYHGVIFTELRNSYTLIPSWKYYMSDIHSVSAAPGDLFTLPSDMSGWFEGAVNLTQIDFSGFDFSEVTDMSRLFKDCTNLVGLDFENADTSKVEKMDQMFSGCTSLETLNLTKFSTESVSSMSKMFEKTDSLRTVTLGSSFTKWLNNAYLTGKPISCWQKEGTSIVLTAKELYLNFQSSLSSVAGTYHRNPAKEEELIASSLPYAVLKSNGDFIFFRSLEVYERGEDQDCEDLMGNSYHGKIFTDVEDVPPIIRADSDIFNPDIKDYQYVRRAYVAKGQTIYLRGGANHLFCNCSNMTYCDMSGFDTSGATNMHAMFAGTWLLEELDLSNFDTSNVTNMQAMFNGYRGKKLDISSFDTSKVTTMRDMFMGAYYLEEIDVSHFDTSNVTDMFRMFETCKSANVIDVSNFNFSKVQDTQFMFYGCEKLESICMRNADLSSIRYMCGMFGSATALKEVDLTGVNFANARTISSLFSGCTALTTIYASEDNGIDAVADTEKMFLDCTSLKGQNGTVYDAEHVDKEYARIDKEGAPGYFSVKE